MFGLEAEYSIQFTDQPCGSQEYSPSQDGKEAGTRQPLVILLGWGSASNKNLTKYSNIYHKRGYTVLQYTAPWQVFLFSNYVGIPLLHVYAQKLLELLFDYKIEKEPLLFHVFSNNGVGLYQCMLEFLQTHQRFCHLRVVGVIFDSCPGDKYLMGTVRGLLFILRPTRVMLRPLLFVFFLLLMILFHPFTDLLQSCFYNKLLNTASCWPELYLYSKADAIVQAKDVERMMEARRAHGVLVRSVDFVSSPHICLFIEHPTQYESMCVDFIRTCVHC